MTTLSTTTAPMSSTQDPMSRRRTATAVGILFVVQMVTAMFGTSLIQAFVDGDPDRAPMTVGVAPDDVFRSRRRRHRPADVPGAEGGQPHALPSGTRSSGSSSASSPQPAVSTSWPQSQVVPNHLLWVYVPTGIGGIILCYLLFVSRLVPRPIALLGLVGYASLTIGVPLDLLGVLDMSAGAGLLLVVPGGLFELVFLPIWLIAKGFSAPRSVA